jgi:hypothetical protein
MSDLLSTDAVAAAFPIIKKALDGLAPTIRRGAGALGKTVIDRTIANLQMGFGPYLRTSFERCSSVKTLLSQDRPLALLDIYVHLLLDCIDLHFIDDDLIDQLPSYRRIMITGLAGCGKSMFMKYLNYLPVYKFTRRDPLICRIAPAQFAYIEESPVIYSSIVRIGWEFCYV